MATESTYTVAGVTVVRMKDEQSALRERVDANTVPLTADEYQYVVEAVDRESIIPRAQLSGLQAPAAAADTVMPLEAATRMKESTDLSNMLCESSHLNRLNTRACRDLTFGEELSDIYLHIF